jgi:hypothetical protein
MPLSRNSKHVIRRIEQPAAEAAPLTCSIDLGLQHRRLKRCVSGTAKATACPVRKTLPFYHRWLTREAVLQAQGASG